MRGIWLGLFAMGAWHGLNPAMGWLFAVALGNQRGSGAEIGKALLPLGAGHAFAMGASLLIALVLGLVLPAGAIRWLVGAVLIGYGLRRLVRPKHAGGAGMDAGPRQLAAWSFLTATAHGAGLMVLPLLLGEGSGPAEHRSHVMATAGIGAAGSDVLAAIGFHTAGYLVVTGVLAIAVHGILGLRWLRRWWINMDLFWALALIGTGVATAVTG